MTNEGRDRTGSMNVGHEMGNGMSGEHSANKRITILIVNSKPRKKENRARWPAIFISMIMIIGIFAIMPVQAASPATPVPDAGPAPVNLGTAGDFVILAQSGITTTGVTSIVGDIGVSPIASTAITGFGLVMDPSGEFSTTVPTTLVTGKVYAANYANPTPAKMGTAVGDMGAAYTDAAGRLIPDYFNLYSGDVTGQTLTPGLWKWTTGLMISAAGVTISGAPSDVWIFQIAQDLTVANTAIITLDGGAQASNIFWQVAGQTVLGTTSQFKGIILCQTQIVIQNGASLNGRALAQTLVTTDANSINVPTYLGANRAADNLSVERATPNILLHWQNFTGNPTNWHVYCSNNNQAVFPGGWTMVSIAGNLRTWTHAGAYADGLNWFYIVRGYDGAIESINSTMGVKLDKTFIHNTLPMTNVNFISLPYNSMYKTARDVVIDLEGGDGMSSGSTKINVVGLWMPEDQCSTGYVHVPEWNEWTGDNFVIPPGVGIYVSVLSDFNWIINGTDSLIQLDFTPNIAKTNIVWLSMLYTGIYSTPSDIVMALEGGNGVTSVSTKVTAIGKWNQANQIRTSYYYDPVSAVWMGDDSIIAPGEGFYLDVMAAFTWVPGMVTPECNGANFNGQPVLLTTGPIVTFNHVPAVIETPGDLVTPAQIETSTPETILIIGDIELNTASVATMPEIVLDSSDEFSTSSPAILIACTIDYAYSTPVNTVPAINNIATKSTDTTKWASLNVPKS
jgi:hypothetical protein